MRAGIPPPAPPGGDPPEETPPGGDPPREETPLQRRPPQGDPREETHPPPPGSRLRHTINERPVRILLECILVFHCVRILTCALCPLFSHTHQRTSSMSSQSQVFQVEHACICDPGLCNYPLEPKIIQIWLKVYVFISF